MMNPRIHNRISPIVGASQTLLTPNTKEVVADTEHGGACFNQDPGQVSRTGRDGSTPGDTILSVRSKTYSSPVLIGIPTISPACGISRSLQVGKKRQSTCPDKVTNAQKLETVIDRKLPDNPYFSSVFSKVISREISHGSRDGLYLCCRMKLSSNVVETEASQFVDLELPVINTSN